MEQEQGQGQEQNNSSTTTSPLRGNAAHTHTEATEFSLPNFSSPEPTAPSQASVSDKDSPIGPEGIFRRTNASRKAPTVHKLLSTRGHLSFDQLAGRARYFGPTTNCHIYSDVTAGMEESRRQAKEQERRTQRVLSALPQATHDYLLNHFWEYYNSVIHVIHREAFEEGRKAGGGPFYSGFLHICILATGYRFADKQRPDIVSISLPGRESTLHREAKYMLDYEMERPGGIQSIAALLLLGDLEAGCGRDNVGWLYSGMAYRLCFDVGLHLNRSNSGLSQRDIEIGRMTLWACVVYDRYWALFLGRPTVLKPDDLEIYELSEQFDRLGTCQPTGKDANIETQVYQALIEVMDLAGKITEFMDKVSNRGANLDRLVYFRMSVLDRDLEKWYARLPPALQYNAENIKTAPFSFFLLHQQYYSTKILLHRQFARYDDIMDNKDEDGMKNGDSSGAADHLSAMSRATCTTCAGRIAQIFWQHRQRFDTRKIFVTGLQHAGNAATALVAAIASSTDPASNDKNRSYLECLTAALKDMAETYQPGEQMAAVLDLVLLELQDLRPDPKMPSMVPARRGSSADREDAPGFVISKRGGSGRSPAGESPLQSMSFPKDQSGKPSSAVLPSPAPISQTRPEGQVNYGMANDFVIVPNDMTNIDGPWPMFNESWAMFSGPDHFIMKDGMGANASPPAFISAYTSAETPGIALSSLEGAKQSSFMTLLEDPEDAMQSTDNSSTDKGRPLASNDGVNAGILGTSEAPPGTVGFSELRGSSCDDRLRGYQPSAGKSASGTGYTPAMSSADNIWTEIIN